MTYINADEYEAHGLETTTPAALVTAASSLIDAHCRRPTLAVSQYVERLRLRPGRGAARLSYLPLAAVAPATTPIVAARGRFAVPRRGEGGQSDFAAGVAQAFGLPGAWTSLDAASIEYDAETGELTFAVHPLGLSCNEVEVTYTAGLSPIPPAVKFACAQIVRNALATPALNVRAGDVNTMHMEYFADSLLAADVRMQLSPYVTRKLG
jgi:hypothetical protein